MKRLLACIALCVVLGSVYAERTPITLGLELGGTSLSVVPGQMSATTYIAFPIMFGLIDSQRDNAAYLVASPSLSAFYVGNAYGDTTMTTYKLSFGFISFYEGIVAGVNVPYLWDTIYKYVYSPFGVSDSIFSTRIIDVILGGYWSPRNGAPRRPSLCARMTVNIDKKTFDLGFLFGVYPI